MLSFGPSLGVALLLVVACTPTKKSQPTASAQIKSKTILNLHDVSVLFPLRDWNKEQQNEHFKIALDSQLEGSEGFIPKGTTKKYLGTEKDEEKYYRLSSLRIDPCVNQPTAKGNKDLCVRQIRLVWQQFFHDPAMNGGYKTFVDGEEVDVNIHTIYTLRKEDFSSLVAQMRQLHDAAGLDYAKEALGPHAVLLKEGPSGQYYQGLKKIIGKYARITNLTQLAHFRINDLQGASQPSWNFMALLFSKGDFVLQKDLSQTSMFDLPPRGKPEHPASLSVERIPEENIKNTFIVENPNLHDPSTMDCLSCHTSLKVRKKYELEGKKFPNPNEQYVNSNWNMTARFEENDLKFRGSFHMFSIFDTYRISQRVVNDSAFSADLINDQY